MSLVGQVSVQSQTPGFEFPMVGGSFETDQTTPGAGSPGFLLVDDTPQEVGFGELSPGLVYVENKSELNVEIELTGDLLLKPGDKFLMRLKDGTKMELQAEAATEAARIMLIGFNE